MIVAQSEKVWICVSVQLNHSAVHLKLTLQYKSTTLQCEIKIELEKLVAYYKKHPPHDQKGDTALPEGCSAYRV